MLPFRLKRQAIKDLASVPAADLGRILIRFVAYADDPENPRHDVIALVGTIGMYRLRVGDWRVIFAGMDTMLEVHRIVHRREAYR